MHLLVCDDDAAVGDFLSSVFTTDGWTVTVTASGDECIAKVNESAPDIIVLDQVMPGMTGIEAARIVRAGGYDKPIILFSAYLVPELRPAIAELDLQEVSKADSQAVIRVVDAFGAQARGS